MASSSSSSSQHSSANSSKKTKKSFEELKKEFDAKYEKAPVVALKEKKVQVNAPSYPLFSFAAVKDISHEDMVAALKGERKDRVLPSERVPVFRSGHAVVMMNSNGATWKYTQPDVRNKVDRMMYVSLAVAGAKSAQLRKMAEYSTTIYRSNGTKVGMVNRLLSRMTLPRPDLRPHSVAFNQRVMECLPVKQEKYIESPITLAHPAFQEMQTKASVGLPYMWEQKGVVTLHPGDATTLNPGLLRMDPKGKGYTPGKQMMIAEHAVGLAAEIAEISRAKAKVAMAAYDELFEKYPWLNTFLLKRKDEKMPRADFSKKVRPYGVQPFPMRIVGFVAMHPMKERLLNFLENERSTSAFRFSPQFGGATELIEFIARKMEKCRDRKRGEFFSLSFGDDQLWFFVDDAGRLFNVFVDVISMDLSTPSVKGPRFFQYFHASFKPLQLTDVAFNLMRLHINVSFCHFVHVAGAFVLEKSDSLNSGVAGTTFFNLHSSAEIRVMIEDWFETVRVEFTALMARSPTRAVVISWFEEKFFPCKTKIREYLNYEFKVDQVTTVAAASASSVPPSEVPDSSSSSSSSSSRPTMVRLVTQSVFHNGSMYDGPAELRRHGLETPFLGYRYLPAANYGGKKGDFIAVPDDMEKFGGTLVCPGDHPTGPAGEARHAMGRIMGAFVTGAWIDPEVEEYLRTQYAARHVVSQNLTHECQEADSVVDEYGDELMELFDMGYAPSELPSRECMMDFNVLKREAFLEKYYTLFKGLRKTGSVNPHKLSSPVPPTGLVPTKLKLKPYETQDFSESGSVQLLGADAAPANDSAMAQGSALSKKTARERFARKVANARRHELKEMRQGMNKNEKAKFDARIGGKRGLAAWAIARDVKAESHIGDEEAETEDLTFAQREAARAAILGADVSDDELDRRAEEYDQVYGAVTGPSWADEEDDDDDKDYPETEVFMSRFRVHEVDDSAHGKSEDEDESNNPMSLGVHDAMFKRDG